MAFTPYIGYNAVPLAYVNGQPLTTRTTFVAALTSVDFTETFESFTRLQTAPLSIFGGSGSLTITGSNGGAGRIESLYTIAGSTPGRFNTTGATAAFTNGVWWQSSIGFKISFPSAKSAFGCYITDPGDFRGSLTATAISGGVDIQTVDLSSICNNSITGALGFFGFTDDTGQTYDSVRFNITQQAALPVGQYDVMGFDDVFLGTFAAPVMTGNTVYVLAGQ